MTRVLQGVTTLSPVSTTIDDIVVDPNLKTSPFKEEF